jgi:hypothetical protein
MKVRIGVAFAEVESINAFRVERVPATDGALTAMIKFGLQVKRAYWSPKHF